ncbi:glycine-rich protein [Odoribacter lunatus]|uniref:glycine-rich protein n=1 Tax=Odoribacter lunatus TaxID=2941335 RepID=UPI00203A52A9|nr:glycine-rich protein [Odoribacter lunatus]
MKKLIKCAGMRRLRMSLGLLFVVTLSGLFSPPVFGNNIRVDGKTRVIDFSGDTAVIEVYLRWDNSWRDDFNWDAAWVFFKYKKRGLENPWQHAYLGSSGHVLSRAAGNEDGGYAYMVGTNSSKVNGLYVMREGISEGNVSVRLQAKWPLEGTGLTRSDFGEALNEIYVAVHAIEMVYVPYGAYYLGDAYSNKSFVVGGTEAVVIDTEAAMTLSAKDGMSNVSLSASYPKGYAGFYIMKYEISQEQYAEFLNSLTLAQQKARVENNDFANMKRGDYVFGDLHTPSCRNGIVFIEQRQPNTPAVFGNNLNPSNDLFSTDDGQTLACNYMSIEDMIAYCSWSGLRPMSELEYEKACRRFYPQEPDEGEYAWNTNNGINRISFLSDLNYRGEQREQALSYLKNVNSGTANSINGPVRCGLFATSATNQTQAGATYWAVMEMSGNLKELCANVNYTNLNGGSCGTGVYNASLWDKTASRYGVRGGGFNSADELLRTSDRTEAMNYFTSVTQRDSTVGFRGVYNLSGIEIDGGEIQGDTTCPGNELHIVNIQLPSCPDFPDVRFQYNWYVKKPGEVKFDIIPDATGESLVYNNFVNTGTTFVRYQFKRVGICAVGMAETVTNVYVAPLPWTNSLDTYTNVYPSFTVNSTWGNMPQAHWKLDNAPAGISIAADKGVVSGLTSNSVFWVDVTVSSDKCPGQSWTQRLKIQRRFGYTGSQQNITLVPGEYVMECWGARGGNAAGRSKGGYGAYARGTIALAQSTALYVYVGQIGNDNNSRRASWNGGAIGGKDTYGGVENGGAGGGASDVRLTGGSWDGTTSLYSRLIVAGGGGGAGGWNGCAGGAGGRGTFNTTLGIGTNGVNNQSAGGGGGGGYYGGSRNGSYYTGQYNVGRGAFGGSSFVSGHTGCNAINSSGSPTGQSVHYSGLYFTNTTMIDGTGYRWTTVQGSYVGMPNLAGTGTMTGNSGDGQVQISPVVP